VYQVVEQAGGVPPAAVEGLAGSARTAGLDVLAVDGTFAIMDPELGFSVKGAVTGLSAGCAPRRRRRYAIKLGV
jgi:hypothetical protein